MKNSKITKKIIATNGRKIPLKEIRKDMLNEHAKYMRLRSDREFSNLSKEDIITDLKRLNEYKESENRTSNDLLDQLKVFERTRHMMFWHDGSPIANHSHLLMLVSCMYDQAVYYTSEVYYSIYKQRINIQSIIERPHIYILARCPSTDQQLLYTGERIDDILEMKEDLSINDINIHDIMRIFKGDSPAASFESGHQKGGNYFCFSCKVHATCSSSLVHTSKLDYISLTERIDKVLETETSKIKLHGGCIKLYDNIKRGDVVSELHGRAVKFSCHVPVKKLNDLLTEEMHGIQRLPSLLFGNHTKTLMELNIQQYEVMNNEPLHDISNHIKNLYQELPEHVEKKKKQIIQDIINLSFGKEARNSADHRKSLLLVTNWFYENMNNHFICNLLSTLTKIQEILYLPEEARSLTSILQLIITTFVHAMIIKINIRGNLKSLTSRKFFGKYYHSIISHASHQYRLFSGRTVNTEKEEATFSPIKTFTKLTSNHHPDNIISNAIIRMQAKELLKSEENETTDSELAILYKPIFTSFTNSVISFDWIEQYSRNYQCLLESMADYLLDECWWNETEYGIQFLDHERTPATSKLQLHHFRSTNLKMEQNYVKFCWQKCLDNMHTLIPAFKINIDNKIIYLNTLKYFSNHHKSLDEAIIDFNLTPVTTEIITTPKNENIHTYQKLEISDIEQQIIEENNKSQEPKNSTTTSIVTTPKKENIYSTHENMKIPAIEQQLIEDINKSQEPSKSFEFSAETNPITSIPEIQLSTEINPITASTPETKLTNATEEVITHIKPTDCNTTSGSDSLSGTSKLLKKVLGEQSIILKYDELRKKLKKK